ncbi:hypothetical protein ABIB57_000014 [Devosia sp. UYZn731]|uniref:hypothetical protein n=1 Tax=Devosia sp. UYZn731 TaxID=3156345 RepID=UPI0033918189
MSADVLSFPGPVQSTETGRGFNCFKSDGPIRYTRRCCRDALIQATLDPDIVRIFEPDVARATPKDTFFQFGVEIGDRRCLLVLCDETTGEEVTAPSGFDLGICFNRDAILSEPALTTSRTVWSRRDVLVPPAFAVRLLGRLAKTDVGLKLGELEDELVDEPKRWVDYVLSMACAGLVTFDCRHAITEDTRVALGPPLGRRSGEKHWLY